MTEAAVEAWEAMRSIVLGNLRRKEACDALDVSFARIKALLRTAEGPVSLGSLASDIGTDAAYLTVIVDDLQERGWVERRPDPEDRRRKLVALTPAGASSAAHAAAILATPPGPLVALDPDDLATIAAILAPVVDEVEALAAGT